MDQLCEACVVTCEDFRLHLRKDGTNCIGDFLKSLSADCDLIARAGGIQDLVRPMGGFDQALLRDIDVAVNLHKVKTIHLVNHEDCGAYGVFKFSSRGEEIKRHFQDLREAGKILADRYYFPGVQVKLHFAELTDGGKDRFIIKPVVD